MSRAPTSTMQSVVLLLAAVVVLRSAGLIFGILNIDESDFLVIGRLIREHGLPYVDNFDINKPPLMDFMFTPAIFSGSSLVPVRLAGILVVFATSLVVGLTARRWRKNDDAGWIAAWFVLFAGLCEVPSVNCETLMNLPTAGALYFFIRAETGGRPVRDDLLAGLMIGLATGFKHQAIVTFGALALALVIEGVRVERRPPFARIAALAAGVVSFWLVPAGAYYAAGHFAEFYEWLFVRNFAYVSQNAGSALERFFETIGPILLSAPLVWYFGLRGAVSRSKEDRVHLALVSTFWMTAIAVCMGFRFYQHYFQQFAPPLALLATPGAERLLARRQELGRHLRAVLLALLVAPPAAYVVDTIGRGITGTYPGQESRAIELARWISTHTNDHDRILVWGHFSPIFWHAQRLPGTRYLNSSLQLGNFDPGHMPKGFDVSPFRSEVDIANMLHDLEANRPALVVDTSPANIHLWAQLPLSLVPDLERYVRAHYELVAHPAGANVYRLR